MKKEQIIEEYKKSKQILQQIETYLMVNDMEQAEELLNTHFQYYEQDLDWSIAMSIMLFQKGDVISAVNILEKIYYKNEYNLDLNYNLTFYHAYLENYSMIRKFCSRVILLDRENKYLDKVIEWACMMPEGSDTFMKEMKRLTGVDGREYVFFPERNMGLEQGDIADSYIGDAFVINGKEYGCGEYGSIYKNILGKNIYEMYQNRFLVATEIYPAKKTTSFFLIAEETCVIPIMNTACYNPIEFIINGIKTVNSSLVDNSFFYFRFEKNDTIQIESTKSFFVGDVIYLRHHRENKKLVIALFIDGLPQCEFNEVSMPETFKKFKSGIIFNNAFCNGEWTLPSVSNIFTGKDTMHHRIYHHNYFTENLINFDLYTKILKDHGYICSMIGGDWRVVPVFGYMKNLDRCLYKPSSHDSYESKFIDETIEHIEAFGEGDNFIWLSLMHLHGVTEELELSLSSQAKMPFEIRNEAKSNVKSVHRKYSEIKRNKLTYAMKHLDRLLHQLYVYLDEKYGDDYTISLISDHGQGYLIPEEGDFLDVQRSNIAMMMSGDDNHGICNELVQAVDFFPALLSRINISDTLDDVQGQRPYVLGGNSERKYAITESLYPDAPYYISICDKHYKYFFHTKNHITEDGKIDVSQYQYKLMDRETNKDITAEQKELADYYTDITFDHIKEYMMGIV